MDKSNCEVFYADVKLITYVSLICMLIILIVVPVGILNSLNGEQITLGLILILAPLFIVFLSLSILIVIAIFAISRMRYELHEAELLIVLGPRKERIPYNHIVNVLVKDLSFNVLSSFRMPGIALFDVMYSDEGIVRMYSTHALKDVVLINCKSDNLLFSNPQSLSVDSKGLKTLKKKYGISPKDKEGFLTSLGKRLNVEIAYVPEHKEITQKAVKSSKSYIAFIFWGIIIVSFVIYIVFYRLLPQTIVVHWDLQGNPNGYEGKFWGIFGIQLIFIPAYLIPLFMKVEDRQYTYETLTPVAVLIALVQIYIILTNLGYRINSKLIGIVSLLLVSLTILIAIFRAPKTKK